jgi:DNA mismatch repair protein MutS2
VGDEQSTAANLSTFSAHITNLTGILQRANPGTLVLLDELAGGTDPQEGAALACALLDALLERGAAVAVTTHYQPLKAMAGNDGRVRNASFGIDPEKMAPTFSLARDVPGSSSALTIAGRFGIPDAVIENASRLLPEQTRRLERLSVELAERLEGVRQQAVELEDQRAELLAERGEAERLLAELRERDRRALSAETRRLIGEVRQAREELERVKSSLKKRRLVKPEELARAAEQIGRAAEKAAPGGELEQDLRDAGEQPAREKVGEQELQAGASVYIPYLCAEGVVVEPPRKGRVRVAVGSVKLWAEVDALRRGKARGKQRRAPAPAVSVSPRRDPGQELTVRTADNTVDVRGLRVDEALSKVEHFADELYRRSIGIGFVVHGYGTGALREAVRERLRSDLPYVLSAGPAEFEQGGEAVTMFRLDT